MLELQWPWLLALLPLPLFVYLLPPEPSRDDAVRVPFFQRVRQLSDGRQRGRARSWLQALCLWLIWSASLLAASHPQWLGDPISLPSSGRDMLLAIDLSGSMEIEDMELNGQPLNRLEAIKLVVDDFIEQRQGDRMGLVLFGNQAYLHAPLTRDLNTVRQLLQETEIGFAGQRTAIGDAIGLSVKRLRERDEDQKVIILLTDGANNSGELTPQRAAYLAEQHDITIHTIGFGAEEMVTQTIFGERRVNPTRDLDEGAMREVAAQTGGQYFRARNLEELAQVHQTLDRLEPIDYDDETYRPVRSLFHWPLAVAFVLSGLLALGRALSRRETQLHGGAAL